MVTINKIETGEDIIELMNLFINDYMGMSVDNFDKKIQGSICLCPKYFTLLQKMRFELTYQPAKRAFDSEKINVQNVEFEILQAHTEPTNFMVIREDDTQNINTREL